MNHLSHDGYQSGENHSPMNSHYRNMIHSHSDIYPSSSNSNFANSIPAVEGSHGTFSSNPIISSNMVHTNSFQMPTNEGLIDSNISSMAHFIQLQQQQEQQQQSQHRHGQHQNFNGINNIPQQSSQQHMPWMNMTNSDPSNPMYPSSISHIQDSFGSMQSNPLFNAQNPSSASAAAALNAGYPLFSNNAVNSSPSSIGINSPMISSSNILSAIPSVHGASPALLNSLISQSTSQSNSNVGTPSDGSVHSSSGYNSVADQNNAVQMNQNKQTFGKPKRSSVGGSTAGTTRRIKFRRSRTGCLVCRKRKVKCDQDGLPCKQCRFGKRDCHYEENPAPKRRRKPMANGKDENKEVKINQKGKSSSYTVDQQHYSDPQFVFDKLRQTASNNQSINGTDYCSSGGENDSKEPSEHWASVGNGSNFAMFGNQNDGEWNNKTPSTGATSLYTVDGGELVDSTSSSRRVTLSDDRFENFDLSSIPQTTFDCNNLNKDGVEMFNNFTGIPHSLEGIGMNANSTHQSIPAIDRKTSLSPLHMDAMHNSISANFDPTIGIRNSSGPQPGR